MVGVKDERHLGRPRGAVGVIMKAGEQEWAAPHHEPARQCQEVSMMYNYANNLE